MEKELDKNKKGAEFESCPVCSRIQILSEISFAILGNKAQPGKALVLHLTLWLIFLDWERASGIGKEPGNPEAREVRVWPRTAPVRLVTV